MFFRSISSVIVKQIWVPPFASDRTFRGLERGDGIGHGWMSKMGTNVQAWQNFGEPKGCWERRGQGPSFFMAWNVGEFCWREVDYPIVGKSLHGWMVGPPPFFKRQVPNMTGGQHFAGCYSRISQAAVCQVLSSLKVWNRGLHSPTTVRKHLGPNSVSKQNITDAWSMYESK